MTTTVVYFPIDVSQEELDWESEGGTVIPDYWEMYIDRIKIEVRPRKLKGNWTLNARRV